MVDLGAIYRRRQAYNRRVRKMAESLAKTIGQKELLESLPAELHITADTHTTPWAQPLSRLLLYRLQK